MPNITQVSLVDLSYYDITSPAQWKDLYCAQPGGTESRLERIELYRDASGFTPNQGIAPTLHWNNFSNGTDSGLSIFGSAGNLLSASRNSIRIRYKIETISAGGSLVTSDSFYYQMINCKVPASGALQGVPVNPTGTVAATLVLAFPAFINDMFATPIAAQVQAYLATAANWTISLTDPQGANTDITPSTATLGTPAASAAIEHGGYSIPVNLAASLPVTQSGTYTIDIKFHPNDGSTIALLCFSSFSATVTVNMGSPAHPTVYSMDPAVSLYINFGV